MSGRADHPRGPVLVVDDDQQITKFIKLLLSVVGLEVLEAQDVPTALTLVRELRGNISLLLTDIQMNGMSGIDLAKSVTAQFPTMPVLFMSTVFSSGQLASEVPGSGYLPKPFRSEALITAVRACLQHGNSVGSTPIRQR